VRRKLAAVVLAAVVAACARAPIGQGDGPAALTIRRLETHHSSPSPLLEVTTGHVRGVFPDGWEARPLASGSYPREGFVASPRIQEWARRDGTVQGVEAFWIDVAKGRIPSDYYYLAARSSALSSLTANKRCTPAKQRVFVDRPPDLTGATFSPSDFAATASGTCRTDGRPTRWAYAVVAPGFGPARQVGIPTSGLYVVIAVVSGPKSEFLLKEILQGARFDDASLSQMIQAAGQVR
jgi:hypothetical protein